MGALRAVRVWLSRARAGQGTLDHDVQWDGRWPLGRLHGGAGRVEQHRNGLGQRVGVGVLVVQVVRVDVLAGRRGGPVRGQWGRRGRGRQLEVLLQGGLARLDQAVLRAALGDRGGPLGGHRRRRLGQRKLPGLAEVNCRWAKILFINVIFER